jgi:probable addiction module antidote protein
MAKSQGGLTILAAKTGLNRESLYKTFSGNSNPRFETIEAILHALGFRLTVERLPQSTE